MGYKKWLAAAALSATALAAWAQSGGPDLGPGAFGMGPGGPGGHGWHGRGPGGPHAMDPERVNARIDRMAERLVKSIDGTPEQRDRISGIAKQAATDLQALRKQSGDLRRQGLDLLKAPSIDRAAIEALRSQQMAVADAMSKRAATAFADTAEVLTPDQRAKLAERWTSRRGHRGHRG
ncbi:MAG: Spy/CpxP family protein refolding chaperone [Lautropia sp.]